jgi:hypothetical protein
MKKLVLALAAAGLLTTSAIAQTSVTTTTGVARESVQIEPEYRTRIKSYVTEKEAPACAHEGAHRSRLPGSGRC